MEAKKEDYVDNYDFSDGINEYEKLLRKLEADIRGYVKARIFLKNSG